MRRSRLVAKGSFWDIGEGVSMTETGALPMGVGKDTESVRPAQAHGREKGRPSDMSTCSLSDDFEIAPGYGAKDWKVLTLDEQGSSAADWATAISILDARIRSRFVEPAQFLIDSENRNSRGRNGFAVLAIDFLLIETIQGFRNGLRGHNGQSKALFKSFLTSWPAFIACVPAGQNAGDLAVSVFEQGRCALHHTGSTDRIVVRKSGEMLVFHKDGRIEINRSLLHQELTKAFEDHLASLKDPANGHLRKNFRQKMDHICL
jgi:hypothetical protein